ncbi:MAG: hypothetical protein LBB43_07045 [Spirochaetaceae bacterium]|nr:hypothetical protein [Spirochaetaceae bacterium]
MESTSSLGGEYRISRRRVPHLSAESTASLGGEYFISWRRVLHLLAESTSSLIKMIKIILESDRYDSPIRTR